MSQPVPNPFPFTLASDTETVFAEPWQARAFGMTMALYEAGQFTWPEWVAALSSEIAAAKTRGDPDLGSTYYNHWLAALERLVAAKGISSAPELTARRDAWSEAAAHTPHGQPIVLGPHTHSDHHSHHDH